MNNVQNIPGKVKIQNVLISVFDKTGLEELVSGLLKVNPEIMFYSTGGTYKKIGEMLGSNSANNLIEVAEYTGQPEMQGGLVKTLDPKIHMAILSEEFNEYHIADMVANNIVKFDLVVVNLYPFADVVSRPDCTPEMARANTDIGGPTMIRAAAKNWHRVGVLPEASNYTAFLNRINEVEGHMNPELRVELMQRAFCVTAEYELEIAKYWKKNACVKTILNGYNIIS